ncbi:MAG TPA: hypothetical protein DCX07_10780 [Phycisphaerales bacterium]|nr:hypothetical protein [Phycisphaerales bacterium]
MSNRNDKLGVLRTAARWSAAFTLIELLVVIAIISLLVSILLPSLTKAKALAYAASCMSNNHQIGVAFHMYASEYGGLIPGPRSDDHAALPNWKEKLAQAGCVPEAPPVLYGFYYSCPADTGYVDPVYNKTPANYYGMNMYLLKIPGELYSTGSYHDNWWKPKNLSEVVVSQSAALVMETKRSEQRGCTDVVNPGAFNLSRLADLTRHPGFRGSVLLCDGHAEQRMDVDVIDPPEGLVTFWEGR